MTEKSEACEKLLEEISVNTEQATEKKQLAVAKKEEIAEQNKQIVVEKVSNFYTNPNQHFFLLWIKNLFNRSGIVMRW